MPYVNCPTCGERGKIAEGMVGVRIKCKQCGLSFQVAPAAKAVSTSGAPATSAASAMASAGPSAAVEPGGIEVEGLDASSWAMPAESSVAKAHTDHVAQAHQAPTAASPSSSAFTAAPTGTREYKLLSGRDKIFEGRFDLSRLEEVLNQLALQGWAAVSMVTAPLKGFTGALEETIIVLLERSR